MIHIMSPFAPALSDNAFELCRLIAYNRKCINAVTFEGYWSRNAVVKRTSEYEATVAAIADILMDRGISNVHAG